MLFNRLHCLIGTKGGKHGQVKYETQRKQRV